MREPEDLEDYSQPPQGGRPAAGGKVKNVKSRTIFTGDNLPVLRGLEPESVDMVYADPPFNSGRQWAAPIGSAAAGAMFRDAWTLQDVDVAWSGEIRARNPALAAVIEASGLAAGKPMQAYLTMLAVRAMEIRRVLKPTGVFFLHCDTTAGRYIGLMLDAVFGYQQCRNEIVWKRTSAHGRTRRFGPVHDRIFFYSRSDAWKWRNVHQPYGTEYLNRHYRHTNGSGERYKLDDLTAPGVRHGESGEPWRGCDPSERGRHWAFPRTWPGADAVPSGTQDALDFLDAQGRIQWPAKEGGMPRFVRYLSDMPGIPAQDVIDDVRPVNSQAKERTGYPTLKPLTLMRRLIECSTDEGDLVLDPFCGCATTLVAAEHLGREWTGIDVSPVAVRLVRERMRDELGLFGNVIERTDVPKRKGKRSKNIRETLHGKQAGDCNLCGIHFEARNLTLDHIIPQAHGGPDDDENLQLLCGACNSLKGTRTMTEALAAFAETIATSPRRG